MTSPEVHLSTWDVGLYVENGQPRRRDEARMLAALEYMQRLLTPPEQRKSY